MDGNISGSVDAGRRGKRQRKTPRFFRPGVRSSLVEEGAQVLASRRMAQLAQRLGFDLADRSRVTSNCLPTSSRVWSVFMSMPKRMRSTLASRAVRPARTSRVDSLRLSLVAISIGDCMVESSMKSPRCESSSSPIGVSMEIGSLAIFSTLRILSSGMSMRSPSSSGVGSRPISWSIWREMRLSLLIVSIMCTGMRMVRAWSAIERVIAWRIHQVA